MVPDARPPAGAARFPTYGTATPGRRLARAAWLRSGPAGTEHPHRSCPGGASSPIRILDDISERAGRLQGESRSLEVLLADLTSGTDKSRAALRDAEERRTTLGILAGTVAAEGPGIELTITGPRDAVTSSMLLDTVQELRDAGAEAMQIADDETSVRVVAETYLADNADGIAVDGQRLSIPYRVLAIGDPRTLSAALDIPGGVLDTLGRVEADGTVSQREQVVVDATRERSAPAYARTVPD